MNAILDQCRDGRISPEVALARLVLAGAPAQQIATLTAGVPALGARGGARAGGAVEARPDAARELAAMVAASGVTHDGGGVADVRALFDRAVALSPEASVAAYSLGDPGLLQVATAELLAWLESERLLAPDRDVLDLGCGIGRVAAALAPLVRSVLGIDVSPGMVAQARQRYSALANLRFETTPGTSLRHFPCDLVLAIDSFPYLMQASVATAHVAAAAGMLRAGGALAICNLSYRPDPDEDRRDATAWAAEFGLHLSVCAARPFRLWDGVVFLLHR